MTIQELRKDPHLSISAINTYIDCSLLYKFYYVDKISPTGTSDALVFGTAIHKSLADYFSVRQAGNSISTEEVIEGFENNLKQEIYYRDEVIYKEGNDYNSLLKLGQSLLKPCIEALEKENFKVLAIENPFKFYSQDIPLPIIGAMDLIVEDEAGTVIIVDFKTAAKAYANADIDSNPQLTLYYMALKSLEEFKSREILLRFDVLVKTKTPKFEQYYSVRGYQDENRLRKQISAVWNGISNKVFIPNFHGNWKCGYCSCKEYCDEYLNN